MAESERAVTLTTFAPLFAQALDALEVSVNDAADLLGVHRASVSKWKHADSGRKPPSWARRRRFERLLGLPGGYLDGLVKVNWRDVLASRAQAGPSALERAQEAPAAPGLPAEWVAAKTFILGQLSGYEARRALVGAAQVALWIEELERAVRAISAGGDAAARLEAIEALERERGTVPTARPAAAGARPRPKRRRKAG